MALKLRMETVVDALAAQANKMAPDLKIYIVAVGRVEGQTRFTAATSMTDLQVLWLLGQISKSLTPAPVLEEVPALPTTPEPPDPPAKLMLKQVAVESKEGTDAGADAQAE